MLSSLIMFHLCEDMADDPVLNFVIIEGSYGVLDKKEGFPLVRELKIVVSNLNGLKIEIFLP